MTPEQISAYVNAFLPVFTALIPLLLPSLPVFLQAYYLIRDKRAEGTVKRAGLVAANAAAQHLLKVAKKRSESGQKGAFTPQELAEAFAEGSKAAEKVLTSATMKTVRKVYDSDENVHNSVASIRDANMEKALAPHGIHVSAEGEKK